MNMPQIEWLHGGDNLKTLIINGSPRTDGDTASLISLLKEQLQGEIVEISAYHNKIEPCKDCRQCWKEPGCVIQDDMQNIYADNFDSVVIASPIHMLNLSGPLLSLAGRFQIYFASKRFLDQEIKLKPKKAALILVGGGDGRPEANEAPRSKLRGIACLATSPPQGAGN